MINKYKPSKYQEAIYNWIQTGSGNGIIRAVAGSGKTTTCVQATNLIPSNMKCLMVAFNKHIANTLKEKLPPHIEARTLHSLGLSTFKLNTNTQPEIASDKVFKLIETLLGNDDTLDKIKYNEYSQFLRKVIPLIKNMLIDYAQYTQVQELVDKFNLEFEVDDIMMGYIKTIMTQNNESIGIIDFDDMIYLPVVLMYKAPKYDWVFIDEAQDLNKAQFELIKKTCRKDTRVVAVGDERQSIYAFRGADIESMSNFKREFKATELPLSICYRCPKSHIELAKQIVPEIEACNTAIEGTINNVEFEKAIDMAQDKDLILCRINAPLISVAFSLIRSGKKAVIRGRDIGANLIKLITKYKAKDMGDLYIKLNEFKKVNEDKLNMIERGQFDRKKKNSILSSIDSVDTLFAIMEDCKTIEEIKIRIETIFSDEAEGIVCSSVHRAKGLEAYNVFILEPQLMPFPRAKTPEEMEQEYNIQYVAYTRAKKSLTFFNLR